MYRYSVASLAFAIVASALAASSPAKADPYHLIRWASTGYCQVWDDGIPTLPWPDNYAVVSPEFPTFNGALGAKDQLLARGACMF